jgi:uncharacterized membrane-anchored protein YjiN (DUF445 family)
MNNEATELRPEASLQQKHTDLRKMQGLAFALFALAVCGLVLSQTMRGHGGWWPWIQAFCEAAAVGALADWFAVVALFRQPMGLPIPHTALIPRSKPRIADSLAAFVRDHFLSRDKLMDLVGQFNVAQHLADGLRQPQRVNQFVAEARVWVLGLVRTLDDDRIQKALFEMLSAQALRWNAASTLGEVLALVTQDDRHQEVLDAGLHKLAQQLDKPAVRARVGTEIHDFIQTEYPKIYQMLNIIPSVSVEKMTDALSQRLAQSALDKLQAVLQDPAHPWRADYSAWVQDRMIRLRADEVLQTDFNAVKDRLVQDPAMRQFVAGLWVEIKQRLMVDLDKEDSILAGYTARALQAVGERMASDAGLRDSVNEHVIQAMAHATGRLRSGVTAHIASTIKAWDDRQLVTALELSVGRDLQFIRINGTLVGGAVGVLLHAALQWLP